MQGKNPACAYVPVGTGKNNASKVQENIFWSLFLLKNCQVHLSFSLLFTR